MFCIAWGVDNEMIRQRRQNKTKRNKTNKQTQKRMSVTTLQDVTNYPTPPIWLENVLEYQSMKIVCSSEPTVSLELCSWKLLPFRNR